MNSKLRKHAEERHEKWAKQFDSSLKELNDKIEKLLNSLKEENLDARIRKIVQTELLKAEYRRRRVTFFGH